ncbi:MAG: GNAT family N-acetyltransferase [Pseudobdellovibrio sp.]
MPNSKTRFYRHYKNKPYKLIGTARHSETLELLALYESLYDNKNGRIWVRPHDMFFENVKVDGVTKPRFEKINFDFKLKTNLTDSEVQKLASVLEPSFNQSFNSSSFKSRMDQYKNILCVEAYDGDQLVGFKIGYALDNDTFYSWLGGVLPDYQKLGLGSELMRQQHHWCKSHSYKKIETKSQNEYTGMIKLNLNFGFRITGTAATADKPLKILFEKQL